MIAKANLDDVEQLYKIENEVFKDDIFALSRTSFKYHILKNNLFTISFGKNIAGYILWLERKRYYRLYSLAISYKYRKKGLAKKLLDYSFKNLKNKDFSLEVKSTNENAISLYKKYNFNIKKILKDYYKECDGYLMYKNSNNN